MHVPSIAAWYACGRFGPTPYRRCNPSSSNRKIEHNIPALWASIRRVILVRTSFRDAPMSIIFNASSTASLGRVCAGDGDLEGACRLGNDLTFAINWQRSRLCPQHHTNRAFISRREGAQLEPRTAMARRGSRFVLCWSHTLAFALCEFLSLDRMTEIVRSHEVAKYL